MRQSGEKSQLRSDFTWLGGKGVSGKKWFCVTKGVGSWQKSVFLLQRVTRWFLFILRGIVSQKCHSLIGLSTNLTSGVGRENSLKILSLGVKVFSRFGCWISHLIMRLFVKQPWLKCSRYNTRSVNYLMNHSGVCKAITSVCYCSWSHFHYNSDLKVLDKSIPRPRKSQPF